VPAESGSGGSGTVVVDIPGVQRASARLADAARAYDQLAARIRNRPLPEMPPGLAAYVTAELADISRLLSAQTEPLVATAQELRVRAFWAEVANKLEGGYDLQGTQLTEFKAAYASGLLTQYADPGLVELADAYARKVHHQEHPGGFLHGVGEFFSGAWESIKETDLMVYHLSPLDPDALKHWLELGQALALGVAHPARFGKAMVNLDALHKRGVAYWIGTLTPAAIAMAYGGVAVVSAARAGAAGAIAAEDAGILANKAAGDAAADAIARTYPGALREMTIDTDLGVRRVDVLTRQGLAIESKVGRVSLTASIRTQIAKDELLMQDPRVSGGVQWVFSRSGVTGAVGPTGPVEDALRAAGISWMVVP
jgi:hypothetical protein